MALQLYNTLTRRVEPFEPMQPGRVSLYVCGMTPSFHPHLGHARTFLTFDVLVRHLRAQGFDVTYIRNVTDIDDRIIDRSAKEGVAWDDVVSRYYGEFEDAAATLGLLEPSRSPRATLEMPCIIELIERLVSLGAAYETSDGVYFSVERDSTYGSLSRRNLDELRAGERVAVREEKRDPLDFALWKKAKPGEPTWESPWGPGRPGWHIECSAMCKHYLGDQFDIHGGAMDLVFPHHENEIAQTETATGERPMARYWVHPGLLNVDGQKMSKSLGNFVPLRDLLNEHPPGAVRYLFLQTGYRKPSNFTVTALDAAAKGLRGLYSDLEWLRAIAGGATQGPIQTGSPSTTISRAEFDAFLDDDLNTAAALGWLQTRLRDARSQSPSEAANSVRTAEACLAILGLPPTAAAAGFPDERKAVLSDWHRKALRAIAGDGELDDAALIDRIVALRNEARSKKNFAESDRLREALAAAGVALRDSKTGSEWSFDGASR